MDAVALGRRMAGWRRLAGLTQSELARRMGTKQSVISRVESGGSLPRLPFLLRFARATGQDKVIFDLSEPSRALDQDGRRERVRQVLRDYVFNPWERNPTPAEARTLMADGLTRERFEGPGASRPG